MTETRSSFALVFQGLLYTAALIAIVFFTERTQFVSFMAGYCLLFSAFYLIYPGINLKQGQWMGVVMRIIAFISIPALSDDYFRFLWDGKVWLEGINPYRFTPRGVLAQDPLLADQLQPLFELLNSPEYFSVYPPLNQFLFASSAYLFGIGTGVISALGIKLWILLAELGIIYLLPKVLERYKVDSKYALLYILNPLVIVEGCGNAHFEPVMVIFLLLALMLFQKNIFLSALLFGLAISVKLIPILFLPLLLNYTSFKNTLLFGLIALLVNVVLFLPFADPETVEHIFSSIHLYFNSFQFNSFFYQVLHDLVPSDFKSLVAPGLMIFPLLVILWFSFSRVSMIKNLPAKMGLTQGLYLFFAAVVHPWYLITPILLNCFHPIRYILIWSFVIGLSYFTYRTIPYEESALLIALEYLFVFVALFIDWAQLKRLVFAQKQGAGNSKA